MINFKLFMEDGAPATGTAGVSGAGDNPDKTVPVAKKIQGTYQKRGAKDEANYVKDANKQLRKVTGSINIK
jgi:hypothetical protein